jgi:heme a synthase
VTSYDAGMAVPDWPSTYGYNLFLYPWQTWVQGPWDLFIEHGHRLWGACTGLFAIALLIATLRSDSRRWVRGMSVACLALVITQGLLGGMRVRLDSRLLAQVHGIVGPLFFAFTFAMVDVSSRWWRSAPDLARTATHAAPNKDVMASRADVGWAWGFVLLCTLQLMLGSNVRHVDAVSTTHWFEWSVWLHSLLGMGIFLGALATAYRFSILRSAPFGAALLSSILAGLVLCQISLGIGTWLLRYGWPSGVWGSSPFPSWTVAAESPSQSWIATAHVAIGALILGLSVSFACRLHRAWYAWQRGVSEEGTMVTSSWQSMGVST